MNDIKSTEELMEPQTTWYDLDSDESSQNSPKYWLHFLLFFATFATTTLAGLYFLNLWFPYTPVTLTLIFMGFPYSISVLAIIGCHEFGHYFAAMFHKIKTSLPYFLPLPPIPFGPVFGTMGAVIRIEEPIQTKNQLVDIGAYGPIAGFGVTLLVLIIGIATLPPIEYLYTIHPNYRFLDTIPEAGSFKNFPILSFGDNIIFYVITNYFMPYHIPMSEIYHYPLLLAGWLGLFLTAINLLPFGQLDGGHILYAVFGKKVHQIISWIVALLCILFGIISFFPETFTWLGSEGWTGWLVWGIILLLIVRPKHPPLFEDHSLDSRRKLVSWLSLAIFILCFTPAPFSFV